MMGNSKARQAFLAEADGLAERGTCDLKSVIDKEDLVANAKKTGVWIHLGQLMSIRSEKFAEMAELA